MRLVDQIHVSESLHRVPFQCTALRALALEETLIGKMSSVGVRELFLEPRSQSRVTAATLCLHWRGVNTIS